MRGQDIRRHGGDVYESPVWLDASINVSPLGMPSGVRRALTETVEFWSRYPDPLCRRLVAALARRHQIDPVWILCGNGAADLIYQMVHVLRPKQALVLAPTFSEYEAALRGAGCQVRYWTAQREKNFALDLEQAALLINKQTDLVFLCNPNNPTGRLAAPEEIRMLAEVCKENGARLVVDECFMEFTENPEESSMIPFLGELSNMIVIRAFTKIYAMAGLRLGYAVCADTGIWKKISSCRQPWSVSIPAQEAGVAALQDTEYPERVRRLIRDQRPFLAKGLSELGFTVFPSQANYLLFSAPWEAGSLLRGKMGERMRQRGVLIRDCSNFYGLRAGDYRVCVNTKECNRLLLEQLKEDRRMDD